MAENKSCYSGIGGQAVLEGIMMKNGNKYAVAVRKPDGGIAIDVESHHGVLTNEKLGKIPFVRGVVNFVDSLVLGMRSLNYSASFIDEEGAEGESTFTNVMVGTLAVLIALSLFVFLPTYLASLFDRIVRNSSIIAIIEGAFRIIIFITYLVVISLMKDIRRLYMYHGAEHKCINCLETGKELTPENVLGSSRFHKRCGTSFLVFVVLISVIVFFFVRVENIWFRMLVRLAFVPVIAGISYEILRLAGRNDNFLVNIISAPGKFIQKLTTKEPDEEMVKVAIAAVEAIFDWREYLEANFSQAEAASEDASDNASEDVSENAGEDASEDASENDIKNEELSSDV